MATLAVPLAAVSTARRNTTAMFAKEVKCEFLKLFRNRTFSLAVLGFPVMFYLIFGISNKGAHSGGVDIAKYLIAGYACSGMISAAMFGIGVGLATERGQGWLELKRASPMPPAAYLLAKCVIAQAFGVAAVAILMVLAMTMGGVHLSLRESVLLLLMPLAAAVPFSAMSLLIALLVPPSAASGVVNIIYMPMAVLSGLWMPLSMLPKWMRAAAPFLPTYHLGQVTLNIFGYASPGSMMGHWLSLAGFTLVTLGCAWLVFHRAQENS